MLASKWTRATAVCRAPGTTIACSKNSAERHCRLGSPAAPRHAPACGILPRPSCFQAWQILPAVLFRRCPRSIFCWSSSLRHMAPGVPHQRKGDSNLNMHRIVLKSLLIACILTGALSAQPRLIKGHIQDTQRTRMTGHVHPMARAEIDLGPLDASVNLPAITLVLRQTPEQQADLDRLLPAQQDPASPDYHRWLSPEQYADRFGASLDDIAKITAWLERHNLHVTTVGRARTSVVFTGTAGDVGQALEISFHRYSVDGRNHFANTAEPSLPIALQTAIRAIHGLHDFRMQPKAVLR